jgi:hypothetical protein
VKGSGRSYARTPEPTPIGLCRAGYEVVISNPWYVEWELDSPFNAERVNAPPLSPPAKPAPTTASQKALPVG